MKKIQYSVWKKETNTAGGKAKNDAYDIALEEGFLPSYEPSDVRIIRILQQYCSFRLFDNADQAFVQYPAIDYRVMTRFLKHIDKADSSIALIHDLRSIQGAGSEENIDELSYLKHFRTIIAHNKYMSEYLRGLGYTGKLVDLELFDYLHDAEKEIQQPVGDGSVCFAGNLNKSTFVEGLGDVEGVRFLLYGKTDKPDALNSKETIYKGMLDSEEIVYKMSGDYGLVWDGRDIDTCSGAQGNYMRFNNPHKLSLYIASGKPVITWKQAAIADFVVDNNIGIAIDSLHELSGIDLKKDYEDMRNHVLNLKSKIANGYFLKKALSNC